MEHVREVLAKLGAQPGDTISFMYGSGDHSRRIEGAWKDSTASSITIHVSSDGSEESGSDEQCDGDKIDSTTIELIKSNLEESPND
ncbi:MAG: hypothetical protein PHY34_04565 [Patescibacteria group bacterium]|nr:hypothetical protein [Patescibacteria group bacterium]